MSFMNRVLLALEGVTLALRVDAREQGARRAHDHGRRGRRLRRRRAVVRRARHQRELRARRRGSWPDVVLHLPPQHLGFQSCDGTDETCPERRNPPITIDEANAIERLPSILAVTSHVANGGTFKYKDRELNAGMERTRRIGPTSTAATSSRGAASPTPRTRTRRRSWSSTTRWRRCSIGDSDPIDKELSINGVPFRVIGLYHYTASPMGTPTSAGGGDSPKAILPLGDGARHLNFWMRGNDLIVKPRAGVAVDEATDDVTALLRAKRSLGPSEVEQLRHRHAGPPARDVQQAIRDVLSRRAVVVGGRPARRGRRRRRDHDDLGHGAHARDRGSQGARCDARHDSLAVPRRGGDAHRHRRRRRAGARRACRRGGSHGVALDTRVDAGDVDWPRRCS